MQLRIHGPLNGKGELCKKIIGALPEWFGDSEANAMYVQQAEFCESFVASIDRSEVGILTVATEFSRSAEIVMMGVLPQFHRNGVGSGLVSMAEKHLNGRGVEFLHVKTLGPSADSPEYAATRAFYSAVGFTELAVWEGVWDAPCLQMVKHLDP